MNQLETSPGISTRQQSEADKQQRFEDFLAELCLRFVNLPAEDIDGAIEQAQQTLCESLGLDRSSLFQCFDQEPGALLLTHIYERGKDNFARRLAERRPDALVCSNVYWVRTSSEPASDYARADVAVLFPWIYQQLRGGKVLVISSLDELPEEGAVDRETFQRYGTKSTVLVPLVSVGRWFGCLTFASVLHQRLWSELEVRRFQFVANLFTNVLARKRSDEALARSYTEIRKLKERLQLESNYLKTEIKLNSAHGQIIGRSQALKQVLHLVEHVAPTDSAVLINGETGTGKELIAQEIHRLSKRKDRLMVLVNCAALPSALVESELFGRERGAYTGALTSQVGRFEIADGSTIFLDEVGELTAEVQAKLLRVLQQGEFQRLGSPKTHKVDVRIIAATNRDLSDAVRKGRFREDLYYRLRVFPIDLPPLRERLDDIPALVFAFVEEFSTRMGKRLTKVPRKAMDALQRYSWPGNIRELRNVVEHSVILSSGDTLKLSMTAEAPLRDTQPLTLADAEREHILKALESTNWRIKGPHGAATRLGLQPSTLYSRMQKLGIPHRRQKDDMGL